MMGERGSSRSARTSSPFRLSLSSPANDYLAVRKVYALAIARTRKPAELAPLDDWIHSDFPTAVKARSPPHVVASELSRVMQWKLLKGKFRPGLQRYVDELSEKAVAEASGAALKKLASGDLKGALTSLSVPLKGVGPATASAVLSVLAPEKIAFMSDEALDSVCGSRGYTVQEAITLAGACVAKANELNAASASASAAAPDVEGAFPLRGKWTANMVALCIWSANSGTKDTGALSDTTKAAEKIEGGGTAATAKAAKKRRRGD